jgi:hypothetical protein
MPLQAAGGEAVPSAGETGVIWKSQHSGVFSYHTIKGRMEAKGWGKAIRSIGRSGG